MSEPVLRLDPERLSVEPGGQVTAALTVYNPGHRVEGYDLDVVAQDAMPWATVTPATLSVYPQQEESAVVTFAPPTGPGAPSGTLPFGVRARSQVDPALSAVVEGDLDLGSVSGLQATLTPVTSSGRWSGRHTLKVSNWGNSAARLRLVAQDPDEALGFLVSPSAVEVPLGGEAVARVKVRTRHPVLRGTVQRLPFQVVCEPEVPETLGAARPSTTTTERPVVDGGFNQKPILSRLVVAVAGLLLLALIGGLVWLLTREDAAPPEEEAGLPAAPTGLRAVGNISDSEVILEWEAVEGVSGYKVSSINPDTGARAAALEVADPDATTVAVTMPASTRLCFQIKSVRDDAESADFAPASPDEVCDQTEPPATEEELPAGVTEPGATVSPPIDEVDGGGTPTTGPNGNGGNGADVPLEFISVWKSFSSDLEADAAAERDLLVAAGLSAELLSRDVYELGPVSTTASPSPTPTGTTTTTPLTPTSPAAPRLLVYFDGETPAEAQAACETAVTVVSEEGGAPPADACFLSLQVTDRPTDEPTDQPNGTLSPTL